MTIKEKNHASFNTYIVLPSKSFLRIIWTARQKSQKHPDEQ